MTARRVEPPLFRLTLLPFLDIIMSLIGIFVVVFALQEGVENRAGRLAVTDYLVICRDPEELALYLTPENEPQIYSSLDQAALIDTVAAYPAKRNLSFAFTGACFATRDLFAAAFDRYNETRGGDRSRPAFRLSYRPLPGQPEAVAELVAAWRRQHGG